MITAEINSYKQVAGQAIFEIGRRLKWVKEKDLAKGEFTNWAKKNCDFDSSMAHRFIKAFEQIPKESIPLLGTAGNIIIEDVTSMVTSTKKLTQK